MRSSTDSLLAITTCIGVHTSESKCKVKMQLISKWFEPPNATDVLSVTGVVQLVYTDGNHRMLGLQRERRLTLAEEAMFNLKINLALPKIQEINRPSFASADSTASSIGELLTKPETQSRSTQSGEVSSMIGSSSYFSGEKMPDTVTAKSSLGIKSHVLRSETTSSSSSFISGRLGLYALLQSIFAVTFSVVFLL